MLTDLTELERVAKTYRTPFGPGPWSIGQRVAAVVNWLIWGRWPGEGRR
jgi:hypothetical protein